MTFYRTLSVPNQAVAAPSLHNFLLDTHSPKQAVAVPSLAQPLCRL